MKKFFSMLLALVMLLALAGCGGNDNKSCLCDALRGI